MKATCSQCNRPVVIPCPPGFEHVTSGVVTTCDECLMKNMERDDDCIGCGMLNNENTSLSKENTRLRNALEVITEMGHADCEMCQSHERDARAALDA